MGAPHPEQPGRSRPRNELIGGLALVGIGLILLAAQVVPDVGRFITLVLGLVFIAAGIVRRVYGLVIAGGILTGVGAGVVLTTAFPDAPGGSLMLLSMAAGFLGIWVLGALLRLPENHWWPFIPGTILGIVGLGLLGAPVFLDLASWWPLLLVVIGLLVIAGTLLRRDSRR